MAIIVGTPQDDTLTGGTESDTISGLAGNDVLDGGPGDDILDGGDGYDRFIISAGRDEIRGGAVYGMGGWIDFSLRSDNVTLNLSNTDWQAVGQDAIKLSNITGAVGSSGADNITAGDYSAPFFLEGRAGDDVLTGGRGADRLDGGDGADRLGGGDGNDRLTGGAGDDVIDGGAGRDEVYFSGNLAEYRVEALGGGAFRITDLRSNPSDGVDMVSAVERAVFADRARALDLGADTGVVPTAVRNVLRGDDPGLTASLEDGIARGAWGGAGAVDTIIRLADYTTSVATLSYQFFTGATPTAAGLDYLVSPTGPNPNNLNSEYYRSFNIENRAINFAVNLGKDGEGRATFEAKHGGLSLFEATRAAYAEIFGTVPADSKVSALLDPTFNLNGTVITRAQYFAIYGGDGASGIGTKAAMVGWLLAEAEKADVGMYAKSNYAYLTDIADGGPYRVDLVADYGKPEYAFGG